MIGCVNHTTYHQCSQNLGIIQLMLQQNGGLDKTWTQCPNFVQTLSKVCPGFVQTFSMSILCPCFVHKNDFSPVFVQPLSQKRLVFVQFLPKLSKLFATGQTLDKIMSRFYPNFVHQNGKSKLCLRFVQVQNLSKELKSGQSRDKLLSTFCPDFVHRLSILWLGQVKLGQVRFG